MGDRMAKLFARLGFRKSKGCGCEKRQAKANVLDRIIRNRIGGQLMEWIKSVVNDWAKTAQSKRAVAAIIASAGVLFADHLGVSQETAAMVSGLVIAFILGDSFRPTNPKKEVK